MTEGRQSGPRDCCSREIDQPLVLQLGINAPSSGLRATSAKLAQATVSLFVLQVRGIEGDLRWPANAPSFSALSVAGLIASDTPQHTFHRHVEQATLSVIGGDHEMRSILSDEVVDVPL